MTTYLYEYDKLIIYPARTKTIRVNGINCIEYIIILSYTPDYTWQKLKDDDPIRVILSHSMRWPRLTNLQTQLTLSCMTIGFQTFYCSHNKNLQLLAGAVLRVSSVWPQGTTVITQFPLNVSLPHFQSSYDQKICEEKQIGTWTPPLKNNFQQKY